MAGLNTLVDTSVLVHGHPDSPKPEGGWAVSSISVGELEAGVLRAADASTRAARLRRLSAVIAVAPALAVDRAVAARYGELRAAIERRPTNDLWIAATALAHGLTLLTRDERQARLPLVSATLLR